MKEWKRCMTPSRSTPFETKGKRLLLFDDLYGSGATVRTITGALMKQGGAKSVHLLTLTKKASG